MPKKQVVVGMAMTVTFIHAGQGMRNSKGLATTPYTTPEHLTEEEIEEDATTIYHWLFSSIPGSVLEAVIIKLTEA